MMIYGDLMYNMMNDIWSLNMKYNTTIYGHLMYNTTIYGHLTYNMTIFGHLTYNMTIYGHLTCIAHKSIHTQSQTVRDTMADFNFH